MISKAIAKRAARRIDAQTSARVVIVAKSAATALLATALPVWNGRNTICKTQKGIGMALVLGIDPGAGGAFAVYDTETARIVSIEDMPLWYQTIGKRKRRRVDGLALADMFDTYEMMGVELVVIEAVGGRPRQSASAAYVFGYGVGLIYMCALYSRIPIETVPPSTWKKLMNVPGKTKADDTSIIARADELFPDCRDHWRGKLGGKKVDRAEAAMMAKFGADHVLHTISDLTDAEVRISNRGVETGG